MANPQTQRELRHLCIDTNEGHLIPQQGTRQLQNRTIAAAPPIPLQRSRSVPITDPQQHQTTHTTHNPTPAESITNRPLFASEHLRERYRLADDNHETTTPETISSPSFHSSASRSTADYLSYVAENEFVTP